MNIKIPVEIENWGKQFFWMTAAISLAIVLFNGTPDVSDYIRLWFAKQVGMTP